jgi:hypothetical protein
MAAINPPLAMHTCSICEESIPGTGAFTAVVYSGPYESGLHVVAARFPAIALCPVHWERLKRKIDEGMKEEPPKETHDDDGTGKAM